MVLSSKTEAKKSKLLSSKRRLSTNEKIEDVIDDRGSDLSSSSDCEGEAKTKAPVN